MMIKTQDLLAFQRYQQAFTAHLRNPNVLSAVLADIPAERLSVYEDIVFTNLFEAVSACFPVAKEVLGNSVWRGLVRSFMAEHSANSPLFREIPAEFLKYLATSKERHHPDLPAFIYNLCHYEWAELAASTYNQALPKTEHLITALDFKAEGTLNSYVVFTSGLVLCDYDYAVHTISADNMPKTKTPTQLLVYCDKHYKVQFLLLNPVTLLLLKRLQTKSISMQHDLMALASMAETETRPLTIGNALLAVSNALPDNAPEVVKSFGLEFLQQLHADGIILGVSHLAP